MWSISLKSDPKMMINTYVYIITIVEILLFAINHYATNMQLNVYNMDTCRKNNGLN